MYSLILLQAVVIYTISWTLWKVFRSLWVKSPLHNLPGPPPVSFSRGNMDQLFSPDGIPWHYAMAKKYGRVFRVNGLFGDEQVYVTDPRALHHIVVKDQDIYEETSKFIAGNKLFFGDGLLSTLGDHHKKQRKLLNPVFSIAHMRDLVPIFYKITYQLRAALNVQLKDGPAELDMLSWMSRTALEYIGQGGLGYSFETFDKDSTNEYSKAVKDFFPLTFKFGVERQFLPFLMRLGPASMRRWIVERFPNKNIRKMTNIVDIMDKTSSEVFEKKKKAFAKGDGSVVAQVGEGKDIMSVLLKANTLANGEDRLPEHELLGQMNVLIFAAHDTTSSSLARMMHLLAMNSQAQAALRQEVLQARAERDGEDLTYDELVALPYLDAFVRESLRLYSPFTFVSRTTRKDIDLPLSTPITAADGTPIPSVHLPNNTDVILGLAVANRDPAIWGVDAEVFRPERWMGCKPDDVASEKLPGVYSGMMTFLGGGRACIGFKFSQLEMKIVLTMLVETFAFELSDKEIIWKNSSIATPVTRGKEKDTPHLPLKVSLVEAVDATMN